MGFLRKLLLIKSAITAVFIARYLLTYPPVPELKDQWWADGSPKLQDEKITPFKIKVSDGVNLLFISYVCILVVFINIFVAGIA